MSAKKHRRLECIVDIVQERGIVSVGALADLLSVSTQTIRRDVNALCEGETLRRRHGHVELAHQPLNTPFDQRAVTNRAEKVCIAEAAASRIPDGSTLFVSIGSTPLAVAQALRKRKNLTVITNNLNAAMVLSEELSNRIIIAGGELRLPDRDVLGDEVLQLLSRYRVQFGIFGVAGVADDGSLLDFHLAEVRIRELIRQNSQSSMLLLDHSKFGRIAPAMGGEITDVDTVILDRRPDAHFDPLLDKLGDRLVLAQQEMTGVVNV